MEANLLKGAGEANKESNSVTNGIRLLELPDSDRKPELRRDVPNLSIDKTGFQGLLPNCMQVIFADRDVEALYQTYYHKERRRDLQCFLVIALFFAIFAVVVQCLQPSDYAVAKIIILAAIAFFDLLVFLLYRFNKLPSYTWLVLPHLVWFLYYVQVVCDGLLNDVFSKSGDFLPWFLVGTYMTDVFIPLRVHYCLLLNLVALTAHVIIGVLTIPPGELYGYEIAANVILLLGANILGWLAYFFSNKRHRKAFLEAREALEVKLVIEEQSQEQERLLLSVLPQYVADEIRSDLGAVVEGQFKKIYMSRHENVSILFADIVGFTAISSTYSAAELVRILNELFARFDKLAEKFHQLRIKILGDCYYCISGAPKERSDHAVLCVHMGLSMVEAIKYVREKTKSSVDMRVGIHTGGVLAGVLGQKQWQFDVYSKDVELANKMESGGLPGRVHISEKTLRYLHGEFEVEAGDGASREESIKLAGLRTYFIVKVLRPYPEGTLDEKIVDVETDRNNAFSDDVKEDTRMLAVNLRETQDFYRKQLYQKLVDLGQKSTLSNIANPVTLCFRKSSLEKEYQTYDGDESGVSIISAPVVCFVSSIAQLLILPRNMFALGTFTVGLIILTIMACVSVAPSISRIFPRFIVRCGKSINNDFFKRHLWAAATMLVLALTNILDMFFCKDGDVTVTRGNDVVLTRGNATYVVELTDVCLYPQYFTDFAVLTVVAITILTRISHMVKLVVMLATTIIQCYLNVHKLSNAFMLSDTLTYKQLADQLVSRKYILSGVISTIAAGLVIINHHTEVTFRQVFLWRQELEEQQEKSTSMRQKNEALVHNILPPNVAHHFLGSTKRDEELLSQSYTQVGVLFASMPNFSDFYTEESVNNQGLECLRFLNEVISDFDALLGEARFRDIIKIKTIGSTYMAASGLNSDEKFSPDSPVPVQWAHLERLTEFALALRETLQGINEQSFNNFILRMGINHGPIIAGVIGARKPHYDMWGNTVNVASRMESTGKAGCIQVVEETANILKEFDYEFEQRGLVSVKGKGKLKTFYLIGKRRGSGHSGATIPANDRSKSISPSPSQPIN